MSRKSPEGHELIVSVVNFHKCLLVHGTTRYLDWTYIHEKLNCGKELAVSISEVFSHHIEVLQQEQETGELLEI
jgi:hypothetical protein